MRQHFFRLAQLLLQLANGLQVGMAVPIVSDMMKADIELMRKNPIA